MKGGVFSPFVCKCSVAALLGNLLNEEKQREWLADCSSGEDRAFIASPEICTGSRCKEAFLFIIVNHFNNGCHDYFDLLFTLLDCFHVGEICQPPVFVVTFE